MAEVLAGIVALLGTVGAAFLMAYIVILGALAPFFWYGTNKRTKETSEKLDETNRLLEGIRRALTDQGRGGG